MSQAVVPDPLYAVRRSALEDLIERARWTDGDVDELLEELTVDHRLSVLEEES